MRIVFINNMLKNGGAETSLCRIANLLAKQGHCVSIITLAQEKGYKDLLSDSIKYIYIISNSNDNNVIRRGIKRLANYLKNRYICKLLLFKINRERADIAITFNEFEKCLLPLIASNAKKKVCWFRHDITDYYACESIIKEERSYYDLLFQKLDLFLFVSNSSKDNFLTVFKSFSKKSKCIPNSVDISLINLLAEEYEVDRNPKKIVFICLARLCREKGQDFLYEAAKELDDSGYYNDYEIWLVGKNTDSSFSINPNKIITKNVVYKGYFDNPYPYLKASDVLISSSRSEGCPNVILEAMALGKAIISTKTSGGKELLEDGKHGLLCDINSESIVAEMKKMFDIETLHEYQNFAKAECNKYSNDSFLYRCSEVLNGLLKETDI